MHGIRKQSISFFMVFVLIFSMLTVTASAEEAASPAAVDQPSVEAAEPSPSVVKVDDTSDMITFAGAWNARTNLGGRYNLTDHETNAAGASAEFKFRGSKAVLIADTAPWGGTADLYVDDALFATVNFKSDALKMQGAVYTINNLTDGSHTLKLVAKGDGWIYVDAFEFVPEKVLVNDSSSRVVYTGEWQNKTEVPDRYGSDDHETSQAGASAELTFSGIAVSIQAYKVPGGGTADVYIDDNLIERISYKSDGVELWQTVFSKSGLEPGTHKIKLVAVEGWVYLDAFQYVSDGRGALEKIDDASLYAYYDGEWGVKTDVQDRYKGTAHETSASGASAEFTFRGSAIFLTAYKSPSGGNADVYIDDEFIETISYKGNNIEPSQTIFAKEGLADGTHTIKLVAKGDGGVYMDSFDYLPGASLEPRWTDDTAATVQFSGGWEARSNVEGKFNTTDHLTNAEGDSVQFTFVGTNVSIIGETMPEGGIADVYIDGALQGEINFQSNEQKQQQTVYDKIGLKPGKHTIRLVSNGAGPVNVDAFAYTANIVPGVQQGKIAIKNVAFSEPDGLYVLEGGQPVIPEVTVTLQNELSYETNGTVSLSVLARGKESVWNGSHEFHLGLGEKLELTLPMTALQEADYYELHMRITEQDGLMMDEKTLGFGVIYPSVKGIRENSPFGLDLRHESTLDMQMKIGEKLGVKWTRGIKAVDPSIVNPQPGVFWTEAEIQNARNEVDAWNAHGIMPMGYINYNMEWNVAPGPNGEQLASYQNRPKEMAAHVEMVYQTIKALQDKVTYWELWNEPWIHGWTWATGEAQDYRDMTRRIWERVKPEFPHIQLIGGGSTSYNRDVVYAKGSPDIGYIDGTTNHPYGIPDPAQMHYAAVQKALDKLWSKGEGKGGMWQTELGTVGSVHFGQLPANEQRYAVAKTLAPIYLLNMLAAGDTPIHIFWHALGYDQEFLDEFNLYDGKNRAPRAGAIAYATMTHMLEDSNLVEELYPEAKSTWGFLFKHRDGTARAALYADEGYNGEVTIKNAKGIKAYDYLGRILSDGSAKQLTLPLHEWEVVYLVSDMKPNELSAKLKQAEFAYPKPLLINPMTFTRPVDHNTAIEVLVENTAPNAVKGTLHIDAPEGWQLNKTSVELNNLKPGEERLIRLESLNTTVSDVNRYNIGYRFEASGANGPVQEGSQVIQVAYAPHKTISIDGNFDDWQNVTPVTMVGQNSRDYLNIILDPSRFKEILKQNDPENVIYTARTAWDDDYFYFEAEIPDREQASNKPFNQDMYALPFTADSIQLAFNTMDRNPDDLLYGDTHYEKALSSDMDYLFIATQALGNVPELHRLAAPGTNYQTFYPTNAALTPPLGVMDAGNFAASEGRIRIVRDEQNKVTKYEIAVSWNAISDLGKRLQQLHQDEYLETKFAFAVTDMGQGGQGNSYWTKEAGMLRSGGYNFAPFWSTGQKNTGGRVITRWGFGK